MSNAYASMNDEQLMQLVCAGNHDAFAGIVKRHTQRFFSLAFRSLHNSDDAHDVVQAAFIKLWQKPGSWNVAKSSFTTWFYRVILNACHDHRRKHHRWTVLDDQKFESALPPVLSEEHILESNQCAKLQQLHLEYAVSQLPSSQRDALNLVVYSSLPQKQAAEVLGVSLKALESLLVRAKRSLRNTIQQLQAQEQTATALENKQ